MEKLEFLLQTSYIILVSKGMVKQDGTFDELSKNSMLFQKLMENARKMDKRMEEKECSKNLSHNKSKPTANYVVDELSKNASYFNEKKEDKSMLIKQEEKETGVVSWNVLMRYKDALGSLWVVVVLFACYVLTIVLRIGSSNWLSFWTDQSTLDDHRPSYYNLIFALLSFGQVTATLANSFWLIISCLYAAKRLHDAMLNSILRSQIGRAHV